MGKTSGISYIRDRSGKPSKMIIDLKKISGELEDYVDHLIVLASEQEEKIAFEVVLKEFNRKSFKKQL